MKANLNFYLVENTEAGEYNLYLATGPEPLAEIGRGAAQMKNNNIQAGLTKAEKNIFSILRKKTGIAVTRQEIMAEVWPRAQYDINSGTVDKHISLLRRKLPSGIKILSVYGAGYMLTGKQGQGGKDRT